MIAGPGRDGSSNAHWKGNGRMTERKLLPATWPLLAAALILIHGGAASSATLTIDALGLECVLPEGARQVDGKTVTWADGSASLKVLVLKPVDRISVEAIPIEERKGWVTRGAADAQYGPLSGTRYVFGRPSGEDWRSKGKVFFVAKARDRTLILAGHWENPQGRQRVRDALRSVQKMREGEGSEGDKVDAYIRHALRVFADKDTNLNYRLLANASLFGRQSAKISRAMQECYRHPMMIPIDENLTKEQFHQTLASVGKAAAGLDQLRKIAKPTRELDQVEAAILLDKQIVGDGLCTLMTKTGRELTFGFKMDPAKPQAIVFLRRCKLTLAQIAEKHGKPQTTPDLAYQDTKAGKIPMKTAFYGRIFLARFAEERTLYVIRFWMPPAR